VGNEVYLIDTQVSRSGGDLKAQQWFEKRERQTRAKRWQQQDEDETYGANQLDRSVVNKDQIRTVIRAFRDNLKDIFPDRKEVPKTSIFGSRPTKAFSANDGISCCSLLFSPVVKIQNGRGRPRLQSRRRLRSRRENRRRGRNRPLLERPKPMHRSTFERVLRKSAVFSAPRSATGSVAEALILMHAARARVAIDPALAAAFSLAL
jgi:hypothetical protein